MEEEKVRQRAVTKVTSNCEILISTLVTIDFYQ